MGNDELCFCSIINGKNYMCEHCVRVLKDEVAQYKAEMDSLLVQREHWIARAEGPVDMPTLVNSMEEFHKVANRKSEHDDVAIGIARQTAQGVDDAEVVRLNAELPEGEVGGTDDAPNRQPKLVPLTGGIVRAYLMMSWVTRIHIAQELNLYKKYDDAGVVDAELVRRVFERARERGILEALIEKIEKED
jgi:hypothetical protein